MSISARGLQAIKSNYAGIIIYSFAQFLSQIVIMRELGPNAVGTFGYALLLFTLLALLIDQGFGWSLIKIDFEDHSEIAIVFSRIVFACVTAAIIVFLFSFVLAYLLNDRLAGQVVALSAPAYLAPAIFIVAQAKLRKELRFREIQIATTGSYLLAYPIVGVGMALLGYGVWSLLAAWYTQALLQSILMFRFSPHSLKLVNPFQYSKSAPLGRQVACINVINWGMDNIGAVFIATLGTTALGSYNAALALARTPAQHVVQSMQTVLFSATAAMGSDMERVKQVYISSLAIILMLIVPPYAYGITHADLILSVIFGQKWQQSSEILAALFAAMIALPVSSISASILTATEQERTVATTQLICISTMTVGLMVTVNFGLSYIGLVIALAYWIRCMVQIRKSVQLKYFTPSALFVALRGPAAVGLMMSIPIPNPNFVHSEWGWQIAALSTKIVLFLLLLRICPRFFFGDALIDVLSTFTAGRRLVLMLKVPNTRSSNVF